jgi:hypothetical protein
MITLSEKIKNCITRKELDKLRIEIVRDTDNFVENQKLFIKKQNSLKRQGQTKDYTIQELIKEQKENGEW